MGTGTCGPRPRPGSFPYSTQSSDLPPQRTHRSANCLRVDSPAKEKRVDVAEGVGVVTPLLLLPRHVLLSEALSAVEEVSPPELRGVELNDAVERVGSAIVPFQLVGSA